MAEPTDPKRPLLGTPGAPLPRLWKAEPDEAPEVEKPGKKSKKGKSEAPVEPPKPVKVSKKRAPDRKAKDSKKAKEPKEGEAKGVLKEETPTFDTYDTRQRVRIAAGAGLTLVILLIGFFILRLVAPAAPPEDEPINQDVMPVVSTAGTRPQRDEQEARSLYDRAREVASHKNTDLAVTILKAVGTKYPKTQAAAAAKDALERPEQNPPLPLFLDGPAVVARPGDRPSPARPEPPVKAETVVQASKTAVASNNGARANLALPANPAEMIPPGPAPVPGPAPSVANVVPSKALPKGYRTRPGAEVHASGWPAEIVGDRDGAPMVLVAGGTFLQGRDGGESSEGPEHRVNLGTFYVDRHEVTVRQFTLFQTEDGKRGERVRALAKDPALAALDAVEDRPVVMVSARDAKDYADWAGKFLPTEAQWEAAARTPDGRIFPWGPEPAVGGKPRVPRQIEPIMSYPTDVSPYGVFDLAGNAWEWTKDWYDSHYYNQFRNTPADNPTGPVKPRSLQLVVKGSARDGTVSKREGLRYDARLPYVGFRCVLQVEGPGNAFEPPPKAPAPGQPGPPGVPGGAGNVVVPF